MGFWDFAWSVWEEDGWLLIILSVALVLSAKLYDYFKILTVVKKLPSDRDREDMLTTFEQIKLANTMAKYEIENLYQNLKNTKNLMQNLNQDISDLHSRISRTRNILSEKKRLVVIVKDDIQEAIDALDGVSVHGN